MRRHIAELVGTCWLLPGAVIAGGQAGFDVSAPSVANGYVGHTPGGYTLTAARVNEVVMAMMFSVVAVGATYSRTPRRLD